nr:MAG TPA: hypothetical protein [Caudoviricetes sp.]
MEPCNLIKYREPVAPVLWFFLWESNPDSWD